jgi:phage terminase large subunit-like protein
MTPASLAIVDRIRALPRAERLALYRALPPGTLASQRYAHRFWARPEQALPDPLDLATIEVVRGGRRAGKTWWAAMLFNFLVEHHSDRHPAPRIIASTEAAARGTVIDGPSGVRTWLPPHRRPRYVRSLGHAGVLIYPSGVEVAVLSAEKPGSAIGQGSGLTLADDPAAWIDVCGEIKAAEMFRQARVSNSEGPSPCLIVPTTARGQTFLRRVLTPGQIKGARVRRIGGTRANTNLSPRYLADTIGDLEGDDWAAEELSDEDRDDTPGALWKRAWIDAHRVASAPDLARVVVAVDPADDGQRDSDETGIVVVGLGHDGRLYVLADLTGRHDATAYAAIVAWAFRRWKADAVVVETNRAAAAVRRCLMIEAPNVPLVEVDATRSKQARAEPLAMIYRDGRVSHVIDGPQLSRAGGVRAEIPVFDPATGARVPREMTIERDRRRWRTLEDELAGWVPRASRSPNGLDALVWGAWYLAPPDAGGPWAPVPVESPALAGRLAAVDPRRLERFQRFRAR